MAHYCLPSSAEIRQGSPKHFLRPPMMLRLPGYLLQQQGQRLQGQILWYQGSYFQIFRQASMATRKEIFKKRHYVEHPSPKLTFIC